MTKYTLFMIFLIVLLGCNSDVNEAQFGGNELIEFEKIKADFNAPEFKWGYLNKEGALVIEDKYDDLREFNEGKAAFNLNGLWGYLNKDGSIFLPARYKTVQEYSEEMAVVQDLNNKYHLIDNNGVIISDSIKYEKINKFLNGRALIKDSQRYGYIDKDGELAIDMDYEYATDFIDGLAIVTKNRKQGMIDINGSSIIPIKYDKIWPQKSGMIRYKYKGKFGYIDFSTKNEVFNSFNSATDFQDAHAVVNNGNTYLLIDKSGKTIQLPYNLVDTGGEGKWMYAINASYGFLNNDGAVLCPPNYDLVMRYRADRAGFAIDDIWGYLDESGQIIISPKYPLVWDFIDGYARMIGRTGIGFINKNGDDILPPAYMEVRDFSEGLARIQVYR
jgi:hypothetical protein